MARPATPKCVVHKGWILGLTNHRYSVTYIWPMKSNWTYVCAHDSMYTRDQLKPLHHSRGITPSHSHQFCKRNQCALYAGEAEEEAEAGVDINSIINKYGRDGCVQVM